MRSKNSWALLLMMLTGIVIGDLGILVLTFGLTIHITVASIIGMVIAIILYRFL